MDIEIKDLLARVSANVLSLTGSLEADPGVTTFRLACTSTPQDELSLQASKVFRGAAALS